MKKKTMTVLYNDCGCDTKKMAKVLEYAQDHPQDSIKVSTDEDVTKIIVSFIENGKKLEVSKTLDNKEIIDVDTPVLPREGQDFEKYKLRLTNDSKTSWKGDYNGGWYGTLIGTERNIYRFLTLECGMTKDKATYCIKNRSND